MVKKEEILARTSNGLDVFRHYLPVKWRVGRNFLNPLYADSKASCNVYYDRRSGTYRMKDFGNGDYSGDCFFLVAKLKGLDCRNAADFVEVLHTIDRELCLGLEDDSSEDTAVPDARENGTRENRSGEGISVRANGNGTGKPDGYTEEAVAPFDRPEPKPYRTTEKPFTDAELAYWGASGITEELLHRYGAVSLAEYRGETREGKSFGFSSTPAEPMFGYKGKWGVKVYRPMSEVRFVYGGHTGDNYCFGLEQLPSKGDLLFLTGGEKDVLTLAAHGFHAICFNSETSVIPAKTVRKLVYRFKHIVLLYDTEQSEQQLYKNTGRLLRRAGRERMPEYLHVYCLTGMSRNERLTAIVQSMDKYHYLHGGIHLVVIDGVADLIRCANDEAESVALIDEIYRLAGIYRTCIAAVVHFVPNGLKLRGHLGSELQRKSAAILSIEKDENPEVSVVKALKVRDGSPLDIPLMQFRWDKQAGMPVYVGEKPRAEKEKRKEKELAEMAREAFARQEKYGYIELCELIQEMLEVKERTAKGYIRYMREKEIIEKEGDCYVHGQGRV